MTLNCLAPGNWFRYGSGSGSGSVFLVVDSSTRCMKFTLDGEWKGWESLPPFKDVEDLGRNPAVVFGPEIEIGKCEAEIRYPGGRILKISVGSREGRLGTVGVLEVDDSADKGVFYIEFCVSERWVKLEHTYTSLSGAKTSAKMLSETRRVRIVTQEEEVLILY